LQKKKINGGELAGNSPRFLTQMQILTVFI
jgi:hypothetical protein